MFGFFNDSSHFYFSDNCYFDMNSNDITDTNDDGEPVSYTRLSGQLLIILKSLMNAYPKCANTEDIIDAIYDKYGRKDIDMDYDVYRLIKDISKLKKEHYCLELCIPKKDRGSHGYILRQPPVLHNEIKRISSVNNCESIFRSNKEKTELSNTDVLDALCSTIPTADSFGLSDKPLRLVDYFVSPEFTKGGEKIYQLQDVINSAFDSETNNQITFLVGDPGSGNASALNAIVLSYVQNKKEKRDSQEWTGITTPIPESALVFDMNIADIPNYRHDDFYGYIKSAIEATDIERKTTMHVSPQAEAFFEHIKMCCEDISKTVALIIHSPECFERTGTITQLVMIKSFWNSLSNLLCDHSNIKVICSTTAAVINQLANSLDDFPSFARFDVCPPSEKILGAYVGKWVSLNYNYSEKSRERKINELLSALKNNAIVYQYVMTSPQAIMVFLTATKLDNQNTKYGSQTHYLKIISKAATAAVVQKTNFDKYSFIVPLSFLAAICCERSSYTFDRNDLRYVFSRANSDFKNMTSFIATKQFDEMTEGESLDDYVDEYISALTSFPFINVKSHAYTFSPIWRNYYCANAIAWGLIGDPSVSHVERFSAYIDEQMKRIRDDTNKSDTLATDWVSIIAMAAKLSRQNAESIVPILEKYTGDISPSHRRGREVAVVILLKMLRNRCFVNDDIRQQIMHNALGFFLYHKQLDDINAIIASSPYKEEMVSHIFGDFHESIVKEMPIPVYNFTIGFLVFNYVDISRWTYQVDDSRNQNGVVGSVCNEVLTNAKNSKEFFISNIENAATVFKKFFSNWNLERQIMFTLALNDFTWLSFANSIKIGEYQPRIKERKYDWDINEYFRILLSLISNEHYQISGTALYACSHIIAAERWGNLKTKIMDSLTSKLTDIVIADYKAREIYDMNSQASNGTEKGIFELQPYCGALRVMVLLEPEIEQIAKCKKKLNNESMGIGLYYRNIWDRYCDEYRCDSTVYNAEIIRDNAKRYLMLMIRPCLFAGAFESYKEQCEAIDLVWSLKYEKSPENFNMLPQSNVTIGLEYDHENECFDYIRRIKKRILELDMDRIN